MFPTKETIKKIITEIIKEEGICTTDDLTRSQTDTAGSDISFNLDTVPTDFTSPSGFGFGHNDMIDADPGMYNLDTTGIFLPT